MPFRLPPGFLRNDLGYAPFGLAWLRGVTPGRVGILAAICVAFAVIGQSRALVLQGPGAAALGVIPATGFQLAVLGPMFLLLIRVDSSTQASSRARIVAFCAAVMVGSILFALIVAGLQTLQGSHPLQVWPVEVLAARTLRGIAIGGLCAAALYLVGRERDARRKLHEATLAQVDIERQLTEVRLQLLQAQIEPHFLFNSLASVKRLFESDRAAGALLLGNLRAYLAAASRGRAAHARLGDEIALARSYLGIFQVRMGDRLRLRVDVPPELEPAVIPTFMVGTLVENAIKHGVAPRGSGGTLTVSARRLGDELQLDVADDGVGFRKHSGTGVGLANIRARLESLFGRAGSFDIAENEAGGVTATIRIPHSQAGAEMG